MSSDGSSGEDDVEDSQTPPYTAQLPRMAERSASFSSDPQQHQQNQHHHHRLSFPSLHLGRSSKESSSYPATLEWKLESPPIVFYGDTEHSSGALVSGQLFLNVTKEDGLDFESVNATLGIQVSQKKPFAAHCQDCSIQHTELNRWAFLERPLFLAKGQHAFPFSILLGGHLPASMDGPLVAIIYQFKAEAVPRCNGLSSPNSAFKLEKVLDVKRSLPVPEIPHHSVRVFPPTNIKASLHYPQVIYPIGKNTLSLRLDGIAKQNSKVNTMEYWKLKKLTWRLEETAKTIAPACTKHTPKDPRDTPQQQAAKKGVQRIETRVIGEKTLFNGWKSNFSTASESMVEIEIDYSLAKHAKFGRDTRSKDGTEVTHQLMVEMVVSQEWAPVNKPHLGTQTGVGRILRMHFGTVLTERAGIGISWDNEAPPIYQDVPPSPPAYSEETRLVGDGAIEEAIEPLDGVTPPEMSRRSTDFAIISRYA